MFPDLMRGALGYGVLGRALERGIASVDTEDPRAHATDPHRTVDDRPYGGGPGMVLKPEPFAQAIAAAGQRLPAGSRRIALSAQGRPLAQDEVRRMAGEPGVLLVAGRYEGFDQRLIDVSGGHRIYVEQCGRSPARSCGRRSRVRVSTTVKLRARARRRSPKKRPWEKD